MQMKKFLSYLCCLLIILSSVWMGASVFAKSIMETSLVSIAVDEIQLEEKIKEFFQEMDIPGKELMEEKLNMYANKIAHDKEINAEVNKYLNAFIDDILYDQKSDVTVSIDKTISNQILSYSKDISNLTQNMISEKDVKAMLQVALKEANFQSAYDDTIAQLKTRFSATEKLMLRTLRFLESDTSFQLAILSVFVFSLFVFVLLFPYLNGLLYLGVAYALSAAALFLLKASIPIAFAFILSENTTSDVIAESASHFGAYSGYFVLASIVCFIGKVIYNRLFLKE